DLVVLAGEVGQVPGGVVELELEGIPQRVQRHALGSVEDVHGRALATAATADQPDLDGVAAGRMHVLLQQQAAGQGGTGGSGCVQEVTPRVVPCLVGLAHVALPSALGR